MKAVSAIRYVKAKFNKELQWEAYIADCLWSGATDMRFIKSNAPKETPKYITEATLPRWVETQLPQKPTKTTQPKQQDGEDIFDFIAELAREA